MEKLVCILFTSIYVSQLTALEIKTCNCERPVIKGLLDLTKPPYCAQQSPVEKVNKVLYAVYSKERSYTWTGYACNQWYHRKEITKFFWGSHDTIYEKTIRQVSPEECWRSVKYPGQCGNNPVHSDGTTFKYIEEPVGDGQWLTTQYYTTLNCISQKITLAKDCHSCAIRSPIGTLTNSTNATYDFHDDVTVVWENKNPQPPTCSPLFVYGSTGKTIENANGNIRLVDHDSQLEFLYKKNSLTKLCGTEQYYRIMGIDEMYLRITPFSRPPNETVSRGKRIKRNNEDRHTPINIEEYYYRSNRSYPADLVPVMNYGQLRPKSRFSYCLHAKYDKIRLEYCWTKAQRENSTLLEFSSQDFAFLDNGMLRTVPKQHCANGTSLIFCFVPETNVPNKVEWIYVNNQLKLKPHNQCLTAPTSGFEVTMTPCDITSTSQQWVFSETVSNPPKSLIELKKLPNIPEEFVATPIERVDQQHLLGVPLETQGPVPFNTQGLTQLADEITANLTTAEIENLIAEHRQYLDHQSITHENLLANEIKQIYCTITDIQKNQVYLLAQTNGLLAARALDIEICDRIESNGMTLNLQSCKEETIQIEAKETKCGFQPFYKDSFNKTLTIGKDGFSLIPFKECFHTGQFINFNGITYSYLNGTWKERKPNIYLQKIKIVTRFKDTPTIDLDFALRHHPSYDINTVEQSNVMSELIGAMQENHGNSISDIIMDVKSKSNVYKFGNYLNYLRYFVIGIIGLIMLTIITKVLLLFKTTFQACFKEKKYATVNAINSTPLLKHDHTDTIYIPDKGLFWKDMCPIG